MAPWQRPTGRSRAGEGGDWHVLDGDKMRRWLRRRSRGPAATAIVVHVGRGRRRPVASQALMG
jgi:hypothetical protein